MQAQHVVAHDQIEPAVEVACVRLTGHVLVQSPLISEYHWPPLLERGVVEGAREPAVEPPRALLRALQVRLDGTTDDLEPVISGRSDISHGTKVPKFSVPSLSLWLTATLVATNSGLGLGRTTMLDTASLRVVFAVLALALMAFFYFVTYRTNRSSYAGWWCASLGLFLAGVTAYLFDGTSQQVWANPLGNVLIVGGAAGVWAGARSLRGMTMRWWQLAAAPVIVGVLSGLDDPAHNVWSGGPFFLGAMWLLLGLASIDLWRQQRTNASTALSDSRNYRLCLGSMTLGSGVLAVYYVGRWVVFLAVGWTDPLFETYFGSQVTTLLTTVLLATVSFSMSTLSDAQQMVALRELAARDGLTGLLNRTEFLRLAEEEMHRMRREGLQGQVILADLDHFKLINDRFGHAAGDRAIQTFAGFCTATVRSTDLVGRYGGEEFMMLLVGASAARADQVTDMIDAALLAAGEASPTVSYGIAVVDRSLDLEQVIKHANDALYRAKAAGRNCSVHHVPVRLDGPSDR